jgi:hypothetical protein
VLEGIGEKKKKHTFTYDYYDSRKCYAFFGLYKTIKKNK